MAEPNPNPYRQAARIFAFGCYLLAGLVLLAGVFFTLAAALTDPALFPEPLTGISNRTMTILMVSQVLIIALMIVLVGWRVRVFFGQKRLQEKLAARSTVGCLRLSSLGCGLWSLLSSVSILLIGKLLPTNQPAGLSEVFVATSGFVLAIIVMQAVAWFISVNFARLKPEERRRFYQAYLDALRPRLHNLADPATRTAVQEQTMEVLEKLDAPLKGTLLGFLSEKGLLTGPTRIVLHNADFSRVDLRSISLPHADLREINLEQANLEGAILFKVNLHKANLRHADLSYANLQGANLRQADLTEAALEKTNLSDVDLTKANVTPGQLARARLKNTTLPDGTVGN